MAISEREAQQVEKANASGRTPVVFIHGLWLLPSSWNNWVEFFEEDGYAGLTPDWPDDPETVEEARANPDVFAKKTLKQVADHTAEVIGGLEQEAGGDGPLDRRAAHPHDRRPRALSRHGRDRSRALPRRAAAADLRAALGGPGAQEPAQPGPRDHAHPRPVQVRLGERAQRRGGEAALRDLPRGGAWGGADADGERQPEPVDRGQGRSQEPGARAAADHRRREGPHRARGRSRTPPTSGRGTTRP